MNTSSPSEVEAGALLEHRQQQRQAVLIDAARHAAARCRTSCVLTSACTSTSSGREPSRQHSTADPATFCGRSARNSADGFGTAFSPLPVISNTPISLTAPKRFFTARTMRCEWCFSPSK